MPAVTRKTTDLKDEILSKIDQKFNELKLEFLSESSGNVCYLEHFFPGVKIQKLSQLLGASKFHHPITMRLIFILF